ncbi:MAG: M23 family metallopeptidase [Caldilineaceae bacterium]|nr:M23 family metallopeptidase [Caldilineaceae bacterium]
MTLDSNFTLGRLARTTTAVNLRRTPGVRNKPAGDVLATIPTGSRVRLIDGPRRLDDLTWWEVETDADGRSLTGWMAEATAAGLPLLEIVRDLSSPTIQINGDAITQATVRLRQSPGYVNKPPTDIIADIPPNMQIRVVGGPQAIDGLIWWQVEAQVQNAPRRGWMAERDPNGVMLLLPASGGSTPPAPEFQPGDILTTRASVRVRRSPGHLNQPVDDTLGIFWPNMTLFVRGGPQVADTLTWWFVTGITTGGSAVTGWVAQRVETGAVLISLPPALPGAPIPNPSQNRYLGAPHRGRHLISQLFGQNPGFYGQYTYDGVPLRGHNGVDFAMPIGTDLLAVDSGRVSQLGFDANGYGHYVVLQHSWGESLYAHMAQVGVGVGQIVAPGGVIGPSGNSGSSTGPHLHFAIRIPPYSRGDGWGGFSDPLPYLNPNIYILPSALRQDGTRNIEIRSAEALLAESIPPSPLSAETPENPRP